MISDLLDRPIAFHRCLVDIAGGIPGAIMLSQALYWSKRTTHPNGEFYKTAEEWEDETAVQQKTQTRIRAVLVRLGVFEERYERLTHRLWFRVNVEKLEELLIGNPPLVKVSSGHKTERAVPTGQIDQSSNGAESTAETTYREHESIIDSSEQEGEQKELIPIETSEEAHKHRMIEHMKFQKKVSLANKTFVRESLATMADEILAAYPRQVRMEAARKVVLKKLAKYDYGFLLTKTKAYANECRDRERKFIRFPVNWFREDGFMEVEGRSFPDESKNQPRILSAEDRRAQTAAIYGNEK